jgi:glycosyltransferase involved in cell wall biosynthesis
LTREIFLLCEYPTLNGGERSMLSTLGGVRRAGFSPVVLAPPQGPLAEALAAADVEIIPFDCLPERKTRGSLGRLREKLSAILSRRRPKLLHANSLSMGRMSGPVAVAHQLPSIGHLRDIIGLGPMWGNDVDRHTRLLAVSQATRRFHIAGGLTGEKIHVLYNGVDLEEFCPRKPTGYLHSELGLPTKTLLIATIGRIGMRKGQDVLLRAATQIERAFPDVHYLVVGARHSEKEESRRFEQVLHNAVERDLRGRVHFLGIRPDVSRLLNELTLLVHPARQEPLGRVLLEAAAAGAPVVATEVGGTSEIFPPEKNAARLVPPEDSNALADAIQEMLSDSSLRRRMAAKARRQAEEQFDIRASVDGLLAHYRALI